MTPKKMLLVVNPCAGQRRVARKLTDILAYFCASGYLPTVAVTQYGGHARELVAKYAADYDIVVCAGGDGTLNETVAGILDSGVSYPIGYLPCGTTNDLASTLGLARDLDQAARDVTEGAPFSLDIGRFNGRTFVYTASFGAFTRVSYATSQVAKNALGHLAYLLEALKDLGQLQPVFARVHTDVGDFAGDFLFGAISNTTTLAGILTLDKEVVLLNDGKFELLLIDMPRNAIEVSQLLMNITQRRYEGMIHLISTGLIEIETKENLDWTLDGEYEKGGQKFRVENLHSAVRIITCAGLEAEADS